MTTPKLFQIDEFSDLQADACVLDENLNLVFVSLWGRDTAIQQLLAKLTIGNKEGGMRQFHIVVGQHSIPVEVPNVERLSKQSARSFRRTLFGSMTNLWLYHKLAVEPDKASGRAFALLPTETANVDDRLWSLVQNCCGLPLMAHWKDVVLATLQTDGMLTKLPSAFGHVQGYKLAVDLPKLEARMTALIREGTLGISHEAPKPSPVQLPLAA
ncbi:MAG: hypothetical protein FWD67_12485 [Betaproteobacteria bacterium]|nr:hypothetical protein [Betaproteobacteria bacterium]